MISSEYCKIVKDISAFIYVRLNFIEGSESFHSSDGLFIESSDRVLQIVKNINFSWSSKEKVFRQKINNTHCKSDSIKDGRRNGNENHRNKESNVTSNNALNRSIKVVVLVRLLI